MPVSEGTVEQFSVSLACCWRGCLSRAPLYCHVPCLIAVTPDSRVTLAAVLTDFLVGGEGEAGGGGG